MTRFSHNGAVSTGEKYGVDRISYWELSEEQNQDEKDSLAKPVCLHCVYC